SFLDLVFSDGAVGGNLDSATLSKKLERLLLHVLELLARLLRVFPEGITEAGLRDGDLGCRIGHLGSEMLAENGQRRLSDDALARPLDGAKHPSVSKRDRRLFCERLDLLHHPVEHHLDLGDPVVRFGGVLWSDELGELPLALL